MINNIKNLVEELCTKYDVSEAFVISIIKEAIIEGWTQNFGVGYDIDMEIQKSKFGDSFRCFRRLTVVDNITQPQREISEHLAKSVNSKYKIGDVLEEDLDLSKVSRSAVHLVDSYIEENIKLKRKQNEFEFFSPKVGSILMCTVTAVSHQRHGIIVNINGFEGLITDHNFNSLVQDEYKPGKRVKAYLYKVEENYDGFQVFLSRNSDEFLVELFKEEIPEVKNGLVHIMSVARNPGFASIVLVKSEDPHNKISEVGVCIGPGGDRINNILKELRGEKIYVLPWKEMLFTRIAMVIGYRNNKIKMPIQKIIVHDENESPEENFIEVVVPEEFASKIIGPRGRNIDLISRALNHKIKITTVNHETIQEVSQNLTDEEKTENLNELKNILELTDEEINVFHNLGINSIEAMRIPFQEFLNIPLPNNNHGVIYNKILSTTAKKDNSNQQPIRRVYDLNADEEELI